MVIWRQRSQRHEVSSLRAGDGLLTQAWFLATVKGSRVPEEGPVRLVLELGDGVDALALTPVVVERI